MYCRGTQLEELGRFPVNLKIVCQVVAFGTQRIKLPFLFKTNICHKATPTISYRNSMAKICKKHFIWYWIQSHSENSIKKHFIRWKIQSTLNTRKLKIMPYLNNLKTNIYTFRRKKTNIQTSSVQNITTEYRQETFS